MDTTGVYGLMQHAARGPTGRAFWALGRKRPRVYVHHGTAAAQVRDMRIPPAAAPQDGGITAGTVSRPAALVREFATSARHRAEGHSRAARAPGHRHDDE